jgi:hypothetical protein
MRVYREQYQETSSSQRNVTFPQEGKGGNSMASRQVTLSVNDAPITLDAFVQGYIDHVVGGILSSLKGTGTIKRVELSIEGDQVSIILNNAAVSISPFVARIIRNTMVGVVSSLKGVAVIKRIQISTRR